MHHHHLELQGLNFTLLHIFCFFVRLHVYFEYFMTIHVIGHVNVQGWI